MDSAVIMYELELGRKTMRKTMRAGLCVVGAVTSAMMMVAPAASAAASSSVIVNTDATYAGEAWFNKGNPAWIDVKDGKCDGEPVYVEWQINGGSSRTYFNYNGCGSMTGVDLESSPFNIRYRVCVDDFPPASCSIWRTDNNL
jgi:hypothetical protein